MLTAENHEEIFNPIHVLTKSAVAKEGLEVFFDPITTERIIFAPMIVPIFTMRESESYDSMDDEKFNELTRSATESISSAVLFHEDKKAFNSDTQVMISIYSKREVALDNP